MEVYILEHRILQNNVVETVTAFIGSTIEKVEEYIMNNQDYADESEYWWWAVSNEIVDKDPLTYEKDLYFYDKKGNKLDYQP